LLEIPSQGVMLLVAAPARNCLCGGAIAVQIALRTNALVEHSTTVVKEHDHAPTNRISSMITNTPDNNEA
jgi:hypothetical protein